MSLIVPDDARTLLAMSVALSASVFWVAGMLQGMIGDAGQTGWSRVASTTTAFAASMMLGEIAFALSMARCGL